MSGLLGLSSSRRLRFATHSPRYGLPSTRPIFPYRKNWSGRWDFSSSASYPLGSSGTGRPSLGPVALRVAFKSHSSQKELSGRWDLNPRPFGPEPNALAKLRYSPVCRHSKIYRSALSPKDKIPFCVRNESILTQRPIADNGGERAPPRSLSGLYRDSSWPSYRPRC